MNQTECTCPGSEESASRNATKKCHQQHLSNKINSQVSIMVYLSVQADCRTSAQQPVSAGILHRSLQSPPHPLHTLKSRLCRAGATTSHKEAGRFPAATCPRATHKGQPSLTQFALPLVLVCELSSGSFFYSNGSFRSSSACEI